MKPSTSEVQKGYNRSAAGYDFRHSQAKGSRKYHRIEASIRKILKSGQVLDLGCGTGRLMKQIPSGKGIGIDLSIAMLKARTSGNAVTCADAHHLPFANGSFDTVVAAQGVIRYLDLNLAMVEIARILRPGGRFVAHHFGSVFRFRSWKRVSSPLSLRCPSEVTKPANRAGLQTNNIERWRPMPVFPYAVKIPESIPGQLWTHYIFHFTKTKSNDLESGGCF